MFIRKQPMKPVIAVPTQAILPEDLPIPVIREGSFLDKLIENREHSVAIMMLTVEELIALVSKPQLFGLDVIALVGVPGGRYDAVWSSYIAALRRVSLDTLEAEVSRIEKEAPPSSGSNPLDRPDTSPTDKSDDDEVF